MQPIEVSHHQMLRRSSAAVALTAPILSIGFVGVSLIRHPWPLLAAVACAVIAVRVAIGVLTRSGLARVASLVIAAASIATSVVLVIRFGTAIAIGAAVGLVVITVPAARYALARDREALKKKPNTRDPGRPGPPWRCADEPSLRWRQGRGIRSRRGGDEARHHSGSPPTRRRHREVGTAGRL